MMSSIGPQLILLGALIFISFGFMVVKDMDRHGDEDAAEWLSRQPFGRLLTISVYLNGAIAMIWVGIASMLAPK